MQGGLGALSEPEISFHTRFWMGLTFSICPTLSLRSISCPFLPVSEPQEADLHGLHLSGLLGLLAEVGQWSRQQGMHGWEDREVPVFVHSTALVPTTARFLAVATFV